MGSQAPARPGDWTIRFHFVVVRVFVIDIMLLRRRGGSGLVAIETGGLAELHGVEELLFLRDVNFLYRAEGDMLRYALCALSCSAG